jgi:hypothetical protein
MFPEATLFAVVLVLVIVVSFAFLLIRKPSFSFIGISAGATNPETKPSKSRAGKRKVSGTCPNYLGYLRRIPKDTPIPKECMDCAKLVECQELDAFRTEEVSERNMDRTQTLRSSEKPLEQVEPQKFFEKRQVPIAPPKHLQEKPSGCLNFFGYLRNMPKNTLIPDECLGCAKMVECLYHTVLE